MTEKQLREKLVSTAKGWLGLRESNGSYKKIVDLYNSVKPLPRGYRVKYRDNWCAVFVSAAGMAAGMSDIILRECGCGAMIGLYEAAGHWQENDAYRPKPGDIVFYDWQDSGKGDNVGYPEHVGIVCRVTGSMITVIEGNKNDAVEYRKIPVNGRYIRGYGLPDYESKAEKEQDAAGEEPVRVYTVQAGDTLSKIARKYNTTVAALVKRNHIKNADRIDVGQVLELG